MPIMHGGRKTNEEEHKIKYPADYTESGVPPWNL